MRVAYILTAMIALLVAAPARANMDDASNWYRLAGADDGTSTLYMLHDGTFYVNDRGWTLVPFVTIKAGPGVTTNGVFAQYRTMFFNCSEGTMGLFSYLNYSRTGEFAYGDTSLEEEDVQFQAVNMGNQFGLAYQIACGSYDASTLPETGTVSFAQLIDAAVAAYDAKTGQVYVY